MLKEKTKSNKILGGAISLTVSTVIVKLIGLFYKIPLSYILSEEGMAYFNSAYTVYTFFYIIATAGVPKAISILTARAVGEGRENKVNSIYFTSMLVFSLLGTFLCLVFLFGAPLIARLIGNKGAIYTMVAISPSILFVSAQGVVRGYFNGKLKLLPIAISEIISAAGKLILGLVFAYLGYLFKLDLTVISALAILGITVGSFFGILYLLICKNKEKANENIGQKSLNTHFSKRTLREVLHIAIPLTLASAIGAISGVADLSIIMNRLKTLGFTEHQAAIIYGNYTTLALPMLNLAVTLIAPICAVLLPIISNTDKTKLEIEKNIRSATDVTVFIATPVSAVFLFLNSDVLRIIFEDGSAYMASPLLCVASVGVIFICTQTVINTALEALGKPALPLISLGISSVVKILLTYTLMGVEEISVLAAPFASCISYAVGYIISSVLLTRAMKVNVYTVKSQLLSAFGSALAVLPTLFITAEAALYSFIRLGIFAIIYLSFLALCLLVFKKRRKNCQYIQKNDNSIIQIDEMH